MMHHRELFQNNKSENVSQNYCPDVVKSCFVPRLHKDVRPQAPQPILRFSQDPGFYQKKVFWEAGGKSHFYYFLYSKFSLLQIHLEQSQVMPLTWEW